MTNACLETTELESRSERGDRDSLNRFCVAREGNYHLSVAFLWAGCTNVGYRYTAVVQMFPFPLSLSFSLSLSLYLCLGLFPNRVTAKMLI